MKKSVCIGILGGGQLARMSASAAYRLGCSVAILEKEKYSPAGQLTHNEFIGWVHDDTLLKQFAATCDAITLENEFVDFHRIEFLESLGKPVFPSSYTISHIQDKLIQKETLERNNIPVPRFIKVDSHTTFVSIKNELGVPFILKSRKMGYDGYGNALIRTNKDFLLAHEKLSSRHASLMAEKFVHFTMELAVMVARTKKETVVYPVVQTIQKNHICHTVIAPAQIKKRIARIAGKIAVASVEAVHGYGIFGVEMFLTTDGNILVNEMAPRPHNSGHYTIEACVTSQFENHIRAVFNAPLGSAAMVQPYAVMVNLLGKKKQSPLPETHRAVLHNNNVHLHVYGKTHSREGRKMGHITMLGTDLKTILHQTQTIAKKISL